MLCQHNGFKPLLIQLKRPQSWLIFFVCLLSALLYKQRPLCGGYIQAGEACSMKCLVCSDDNKLRRWYGWPCDVKGIRNIHKGHKFATWARFLRWVRFCSKCCFQDISRFHRKVIGPVFSADLVCWRLYQKVLVRLAIVTMSNRWPVKFSSLNRSSILLYHSSASFGRDHFYARQA